MIKCGLCGKEFEDGQFDEYAVHVNQCAAEQSMKKKTEEMKKINEELEELKRAKCYYEGLRDTFKEKYPDVYKANFPDDKINNKTNDKSYTNTEHQRIKVRDDIKNAKDYDDFVKFINDVFGI